MADNYLEQLLAEWYEYRGYFVRRNVLVGRRAKGGYECELDVVAFHPTERHLVHLEPSMDALSWAKRETRYRKKFHAGRRHIPKLFRGMDLPDEVDQLAVLVYASTKNHKTIGGGRILLAGELIRDIVAHLRTKSLTSDAVPEHMPVLRTLQFVSEYKAMILPAFSEGDA